MRILFQLLSGAIAYKLATLAVNLLLFPVLGRGEKGDEGGKSARGSGEWGVGSGKRPVGAMQASPHPRTGTRRLEREIPTTPNTKHQTLPEGATPTHSSAHPRFPTPHFPLPTPQVSLLLPVRNEMHNLPETLPRLLAQCAPGGVELIALDDGSTDGTLAYLRARERLHPHLRVLEGLALPEGWLGKTWACEQLGRAARGSVLVFTDADVLWEKGALEAVLSSLERTQADLLAVWPRQQVGGWGERLLVPLIDDVLLSFLPYPLVYLPLAAASAGNGQLMAFRRAAYARLGGHAQVAGEVLEDVKLARALKKRGLRLRLALGGSLIKVRMYRGYPETLEGFGKNLRSFHGGSRALVVGSSVFHLALYTLPWLMPRWRTLAWLGLLERLLVNLKTGRTRPKDLLEILTTPLAPLAALPVYLRALNGKYRWKGREYRR